MTFLFDLLPLNDVIHETIMPMLDYESIIQLNRCLQPADRYQARLSKKDILAHEMHVACDLMRNKLGKLSSFSHLSKKEKVKRRSQCIINLLQDLDTGNRGFTLLHYYPGFHKAVVDKLVAFSDPHSDELSGASPYFKKKIRAISNHLLPKILSIEPTNGIGTKLKPLVPKGKTVFH